MQTVMPQPLVVNTATASPRSLKLHRSQRLKVSVREIVSETLTVFITHASSILWFAFIGFALCIVLGAVAGAALSYAYYNNTNSSTLNLNNFRNVSLTTWVVQGGVGMFLMGLARGAMSWMATQNEENIKVTFFEACLATLRRWHVLLFNGLIYSLIMTVGTLGLMMLLRELRLDESNIGQTRAVTDPGLLFRGFYVRVLNFVFPIPDSPFREIIAYIRWVIRQTPNNFAIFNTSPPNTAVSVNMWILGVGSAFSLILGDLFLRLRAITAMNATKLTLWAGLGESLRLAWQHFGQLLWHTTFIRIITTLAWALFYIIPTVIVQATLFPFLFNRVNSFWIYTVGSNLMASAGALIMMLFVAFSIIYEGRLYLRLKNSGQSSVASSQ